MLVIKRKHDIERLVRFTILFQSSTNYKFSLSKLGGVEQILEHNKQVSQKKLEQMATTQGGRETSHGFGLGRFT